MPYNNSFGIDILTYVLRLKSEDEEYMDALGKPMKIERGTEMNVNEDRSTKVEDAKGFLSVLVKVNYTLLHSSTVL